MFRITWLKYCRHFKKPLRTGAGEFRERAGIVMRVEDCETGAVGFGEIAPWPGFSCETLDEAENFLRDAASQLTSDWLPADSGALRALPCTHAALEAARLLSGAANDNKPRVCALRSAALLPAGPVSTEMLDIRRKNGFSTFKWKIGAGRPQEEIRQAAMLLAALRPGETLRLDANGSLPDLAPWLPLLEEPRLDFLEQPYPPQRMAQESFDNSVARKLALDESTGAAHTLPQDWPGPVIVKPLLLGDWTAFRHWRATHPAAMVIYSSAFETSIGREALIRLALEDAAATRYTHGLDTPGFFDDDGWNAHDSGPLAAALDWLPATWESWWCDRARQGTRRTNGKHSPSRPFPATSCFFSEQLFPSTAAARARQSSVFHKNPPAIDLAVVVAHKDPADYLGALLSALASGYSAYCANPHWGATEWAESGLPFTQSSTFFSPGEQGSKTDVPPLPHIHIPTGGTGGRVRFVTHTTETLFAAAHAQLEALGGTLCLNAVSPLPPWHISGLMPAVRALASGGRLVLADGAFAPEMPLPLLPPTPPGNAWYVSLVPTQLQRLLDRHGEDGAAWLRQFHCVLLGGAPAAPALLERARRAKLRIGIGYGMTETAAFVALHTPEDFLVARPVSGKILPHTRIRILDANGNPQATDTAGRVSICATSLAHGMPCLLTQDEGVLDAAGHLSILGRLDRFILTGGEKVDPRRVEAALLAAPWVCAALVVGEPDEEWGGRVVALVELADGAPQNWSAALAELTRTALARHCVPKRWVAVPHLPFNEKGKLDHAALSAILRA